MFWQPSFHTRAFISSSVQLHDTRRVVSTSSSERVESLWKDTLVNRDNLRFILWDILRFMRPNLQLQSETLATDKTTPYYGVQ